jgi:hypothetical protein
MRHRGLGDADAHRRSVEVLPVVERPHSGETESERLGVETVTLEGTRLRLRTLHRWLATTPAERLTDTLGAVDALLD